MTYEEAKTLKGELEAAVRERSQAVARFPISEMGLHSDAVRADTEFQNARKEYDLAFARLRSFNAQFVSEFRNQRRGKHQG